MNKTKQKHMRKIYGKTKSLHCSGVFSYIKITNTSPTAIKDVRTTEIRCLSAPDVVEAIPSSLCVTELSALVLLLSAVPAPWLAEHDVVLRTGTVDQETSVPSSTTPLDAALTTSPSMVIA